MLLSLCFSSLICRNAEMKMWISTLPAPQHQLRELIDFMYWILGFHYGKGCYVELYEKEGKKHKNLYKLHIAAECDLGHCATRRDCDHVMHHVSHSDWSCVQRHRFIYVKTCIKLVETQTKKNYSYMFVGTKSQLPCLCKWKDTSISVHSHCAGLTMC